MKRPDRLLMAQMARFATVGLAGFCMDTAVVYALRGWLGLYGAGLASYLIVASINWALNRFWTFRERARPPMRRQLPLFLATNLGGLVLNRGAYSLMVALLPICRRFPVLAVAGGAVAGMGVNFLVSSRVVFPDTTKD